MSVIFRLWAFITTRLVVAVAEFILAHVARVVKKRLDNVWLKEQTTKGRKYA